MTIQMHARSRSSQGGGNRTRAAEYWISVDGLPRETFPSDAAMMRRINEAEKAAKKRGEKVEFRHV